MSESSSAAIHTGDLTLGSGALALLRPALLLLEKGGMLSIQSTSQSMRSDLPRWAQIEHHEYCGVEEIEGADLHRIQRGPYPILKVESEPWPNKAPIDSGFGLRGSQIENGGPNYPFTLCESDFVGPKEVLQLYEQANQNQWSADADIPWNKIPKHSEALQHAISEIMNFLAQNELSALYLPSKFVSLVHPYYLESCQFLATQMMDEARHIDVFLRRARSTGKPLGVSSVVTSESLLSLLKTRDFLEASFLLSILGEGTFLDLLAYIETHAPDEVTQEIAHRTRIDESRHVHFGISHVKHALENRPILANNLIASVERRNNALSNVTGAPPTLQDSLIVLAAGSTNSKDIRRGHDQYRELLQTMETNRVKRLQSVGFSQEHATYLSELHTPNFM